MASPFPHHRETIERTVQHFAGDPEVKGLILAGSIAHGFCTASSDVDVMIVVSEQDLREREQRGRTCFFSRELCTYEAGYVDGKYVSDALLRDVAARGSEPARFAFQDAELLFAKQAGLRELLRAIPVYPRAEKQARLFRFQAQFEAWLWYCGEALKTQNLPLLRWAAAKLTLFGGRIVLAHNELLYPYHKWFLRVLAGAPQKPDALLQHIEQLAVSPSPALLEDFARSLRGFCDWRANHGNWPAQFMRDSELNWLAQAAPVDDI